VSAADYVPFEWKTFRKNSSAGEWRPLYRETEQYTAGVLTKLVIPEVFTISRRPV